MGIRFLAGVALVAAVGLPGWAQTEKPDLSGTWKQNGLTLAITETDGNIHVVETAVEGDKQIKTEFTCETNGKECEISGPEKAKVSLWYNGPTLVELITEGKGSSVVRRRLKLSEDGSHLDMEVMKVVPQGKTNTVQLSKEPQSASTTP